MWGRRMSKVSVLQRTAAAFFKGGRQGGQVPTVPCASASAASATPAAPCTTEQYLTEMQAIDPHSAHRLGEVSHATNIFLASQPHELSCEAVCAILAHHRRLGYTSLHVAKELDGYTHDLLKGGRAGQHLELFAAFAGYADAAWKTIPLVLERLLSRHGALDVVCVVRVLVHLAKSSPVEVEGHDLKPAVASCVLALLDTKKCTPASLRAYTRSSQSKKHSPVSRVMEGLSAVCTLFTSDLANIPKLRGIKASLATMRAAPRTLLTHKLLSIKCTPDGVLANLRLVLTMLFRQAETLLFEKNRLSPQKLNVSAELYLMLVQHRRVGLGPFKCSEAEVFETVLLQLHATLDAFIHAPDSRKQGHFISYLKTYISVVSNTQKGTLRVHATALEDVLQKLCMVHSGLGFRAPTERLAESSWEMREMRRERNKPAACVDTEVILLACEIAKTENGVCSAVFEVMVLPHIAHLATSAHTAVCVAEALATLACARSSFRHQFAAFTASSAHLIPHFPRDQAASLLHTCHRFLQDKQDDPPFAYVTRFTQAFHRPGGRMEYTPTVFKAILESAGKKKRALPCALWLRCAVAQPWQKVDELARFFTAILRHEEEVFVLYSEALMLAGEVWSVLLEQVCRDVLCGGETLALLMEALQDYIVEHNTVRKRHLASARIALQLWRLAHCTHTVLHDATSLRIQGVIEGQLLKQSAHSISLSGALRSVRWVHPFMVHTKAFLAGNSSPANFPMECRQSADVVTQLQDATALWRAERTNGVSDTTYTTTLEALETLGTARIEATSSFAAVLLSFAHTLATFGAEHSLVLSGILSALHTKVFTSVCFIDLCTEDQTQGEMGVGMLALRVWLLMGISGAVYGPLSEEVVNLIALTNILDAGPIGFVLRVEAQLQAEGTVESTQRAELARERVRFLLLSFYATPDPSIRVLMDAPQEQKREITDSPILMPDALPGTVPSEEMTYTVLDDLVLLAAKEVPW